MNTSAPGVPLFEFYCELFYCERDHSRWRFELRDHGDVNGVEAQFFQNGVFVIGRRFDRTMDPQQHPRDLAIAWAHEWHECIEQEDA